MSLITWTDVMKRGLAFQDADHKKSVALMNTLQTCSDADLPLAFTKHAQSLRDHLERENELMERTGFFAQDIHMGEHDRVLAETAAMQAKLDAGDIATVRAYVQQTLPNWFLDHLESMDTMTAMFAKRQGES